MNSSRELEALLGWIKETAQWEPRIKAIVDVKLNEGIRYLRNRRQAAAKRKAFFKLRADETRELLR